ncbi:conserved hypothetical protein [Culex quinquefasciatus]|uniref:EF-hand domain-containing protein n=1 Tax=Culex quinquefasciatus TaxID=7176 RepID=B0W4D5_CULQU|nr:conserved hypothetical protein [Culex quinquefasciatus]|eukprot:XP_001843577.1 conserved hypothetical protein [Culex quinquefasciatus]
MVLDSVSGSCIEIELLGKLDFGGASSSFRHFQLMRIGARFSELRKRFRNVVAAVMCSGRGNNSFSCGIGNDREASTSADDVDDGVRPQLFHFPNGKPPAAITTETTMQRLEQVFDSLPNYECSRDKFHKVVTMCQVPLYWRVPLFMCTPLTATGCVNGDKFISFWRQMTSFCHDPASRFVYIMSRGDRTRSFILPEDFAPLIQDVVDTHPGLAFLKEAAEFHSRYVHTVIARIFYSVNRSWTGKITVPELRKSNLLDVMQLLEEEEDINQIMAYFSYEHFYVIYCKFWELDRDHDLFIDQQDLARHNDHALSSRMIERIFSGCVTRGPRRGNANPIVMGPNGPKMSYTDFVWFLLAEEDKTHPTAIEYWFRCMDVDGDGMLSMYELEYFYEEQQHRMESLGIETLPFEDCLCQMLDMIKPTTPGCITLADLKRCKMTPIFFDTFFNLEKYMEHEQRDPFAQRDNDDLSDWDRYAAQEYELLVAEEGGDTQGFGCFAPIDDDDLDDLYGGNGEDGLARKPLPGHGALGTASVSTRGRTVSTVSSARGTTRQHSANTTATANTTKTRSSSKAFSSTKTNLADATLAAEPRRQPKDSSSFFNAFCVSYDEDDDYESNIDILESQLDDCLLNEKKQQSGQIGIDDDDDDEEDDEDDDTPLPDEELARLEQEILDELNQEGSDTDSDSDSENVRSLRISWRERYLRKRRNKKKRK